MENCEQYFEIYQIPQDQSLNIASIHLIGKARTWKQSFFIQRQGVNWEEFQDRWRNSSIRPPERRQAPMCFGDDTTKAETWEGKAPSKFPTVNVDNPTVATTKHRGSERYRFWEGEPCNLRSDSLLGRHMLGPSGNFSKVVSPLECTRYQRKEKGRNDSLGDRGDMGDLQLADVVRMDVWRTAL